MTTAVSSTARERSRPRATSGTRASAVLAIAWLLLGMAAASVALAAFRAPMTFDAAYNLEVPRNLVHGLGYATNGAFDGGKPDLFDVRISTGPTLLLPVAGAIALLGDHLWVYPLVPVLAWLGVVVLAGAVGRRLAGRWGAWVGAASVVMLATAAPAWPDSPMFGAGDVLGEYLAAAFLLGAALTLARPRVAGLLLGLAVLTKFLAVMALPAFVLAMVWPAGRPLPTLGRSLLVSARERMPQVRQLLVAALMPALAWNAVRVATVGVPATTHGIANFWERFLHAGSGLGWGYTQSRGPEGQVGLLAGLVPALVVVLLVAAVVASVIASVVVARRSSSASVATHRGVDLGPLDEADARLVVALLCTTTVMLSWWVFVSSASFVRHVVPAIVVVLPVLLGLLLRRSARTGRGEALVLALVVLGLAVGSASHAVSTWHPPGASLAEQEQVARQLGDSTALGWAETSPVLELGVFREFSFPRLGKAPGVLVLDPMAKYVRPDIYASESRRCEEVLVRTAHYLACRVAPTP